MILPPGGRSCAGVAGSPTASNGEASARLARRASRRVRGGPGGRAQLDSLAVARTGSQQGTGETPPTTRWPRRRCASERRRVSRADESSTRSRSRTGRGTPGSSATCLRRKAPPQSPASRRGRPRSTPTSPDPVRRRRDDLESLHVEVLVATRPARRGDPRTRSCSPGRHLRIPLEGRMSRTRLANAVAQVRAAQASTTSSAKPEGSTAHDLLTTTCLYSIRFVEPRRSPIRRERRGVESARVARRSMPASRCVVCLALARRYANAADWRERNTRVFGRGRGGAVRRPRSGRRYPQVIGSQIPRSASPAK